LTVTKGQRVRIKIGWEGETGESYKMQSHL